MVSENGQKRVTIQGIEGSFHDIVARNYFDESIDIVPAENFIEMFATLARNDADYAVMAIENTVAGSILPNYALLRDSRCRIVGEIYLRISHNLLALPGQSIDDIREVRSHPMAISQCRTFFKKYPHIKLVEAADTASSARAVAMEKRPDVGAIASSRAASLFGLEALARDIETHRKNYTRFLIVTDELNAVHDKNVDKASLCFSLPHAVGSLSSVLSVIAFYRLDLTKIQSLPIIGKEWQYLFYVDVVFEDFVRYRQALSAIRPLTDIFQILGEYRQGRKSFEQVNHQLEAEAEENNDDTETP
jgi:prephenate dehydratase